MNEEKIILFKYSAKNPGKFSIDSKELSIALDGINDLMIGILYKIKKEELEEEDMKLLKDEIEKEGKGVDIVIQEGSVEISILLESIWNLLNDNAGGIVASHLLYSGLKDIFKKYNRQNKGKLLVEKPEEYKKEVLEFVINELKKENDGINQLKRGGKKSKPNSPFNKIITPVNFNVNFGLQILMGNKVVGENKITNEEKHLFDHKREHSIVLPELEHGKKVQLTGKISRGSEKNEFNLKYKNAEIKCIAVKNMEGVLFTNARVSGIIDRKYKTDRVYRNESDLENKPQIKDAEIDYFEGGDTKNLFNKV